MLINLTVAEGTETLVQASVTAEQVHYILNYLGSTYKDSSEEEEDGENIVLMWGTEVMKLSSLKPSTIAWDSLSEKEIGTFQSPRIR